MFPTNGCGVWLQMTTNVTDLVSEQVASDSRWSFPEVNFVLYVDDTGFDKIVLHGNYAWMFAGSGRLIQEWKDWLASNPTSSAGRPGVNGVAFCIVDLVKKVVNHWGQDIVLSQAMFAGSGALPAHMCWSRNRDPLKAVESAKSQDIYSGGIVKFLKFLCKSNNLVNTETIFDVSTACLQRGTVMYHSQKPATPVAVAAANDPEVKALVQKIQTGTATASAPCDAMYNNWPAAEVERLDKSLDEILAPK